MHRPRRPLVVEREPWSVGLEDLEAFAEGIGFERNPSFRAIGVAVETQHVGIDMITLLREPRTGRPDFQFAILKWNDLPRCAMRIDALSCGKKN